MQYIRFNSLVAFVTVLLFSWAGSAHPRTVWSGAQLEQLQSLRTSATHREMADHLKLILDGQVGKPLTTTTFGSDRRLLGNALAGYAMGAMILNQADLRELARQSLLNATTWSDWGFGEGDDLNRAHLLIGAAVAYDVLFPVLSSSERQTVRTKIGAEAHRFSTAVTNGIWWRVDYVQNHNWINFSALGVAGYALLGEDSRAETWIAQARENSKRIKAVRDLITDGSWHEGVGYQEYGLSMAMPFWLAADRHGVNVWDDEMLRAYGRYWLAIQLPDNARTYIATHGDWTGWAGPGANQLLRFAAARYRDSYAQEASRRWVAAGQRPRQAWDTFYLAQEYVVYDPSVPPADLSRVPLDYYGNDQQIAVMRSGWGPGSTVLGFKAGVLGGRGNYERVRDGGYPGSYINIGHDHMDDLGLWMFGDGEWLMPECVGYNIGRSSGPEAWKTEFHNALLFDGAGQIGDDRGGVHGSSSFPWFHQRDAHMLYTASTRNYTFSRGDGTKLYPSSLSPQAILRSVALSREGYAVLMDSVRLGTTRRIEQVFHFMEGASQEGKWLRGQAKNDRVLGVNVVSPPSIGVTVGTQTASRLNKHFQPTGQVYIAKVRPQADVSQTVFLNVLWPTRGAQWASRPDIQPLDPAQPQRGFRLPLASGQERWIFAFTGSSQAGELALEGETGLVRTHSDGAIQRLVLLGRGRLTDRDGTRTLLRNDDNGLVEVELAGNRATLSGTHFSRVRFYGPYVEQVSANGEELAWYREGSTVILGVAPPAPKPPPEPIEVPDDPGTPTPIPPEPSDPGPPGDEPVEEPAEEPAEEPMPPAPDEEDELPPPADGHLPGAPVPPEEPGGADGVIKAQACSCTPTGTPIGWVAALAGLLIRRRRRV